MTQQQMKRHPLEDMLCWPETEANEVVSLYQEVRNIGHTTEAIFTFGAFFNLDLTSDWIKMLKAFKDTPVGQEPDITKV